MAGGVNLVVDSYRRAVIDQDYAFNIYAALKSGSKEDVTFDAWTDDPLLNT